jgi:pyruvate dehydrogenase (quinone)
MIIFKNNSLSMDRFEQEEMGSKDYGVDLPPIDFKKIAGACGAEGYTCTTPEEVTENLGTAFSSNRPSVIEVLTDPDEPPATPDKV